MPYACVCDANIICCTRILTCSSRGSPKSSLIREALVVESLSLWVICILVIGCIGNAGKRLGECPLCRFLKGSGKIRGLTFDGTDVPTALLFARVIVPDLRGQLGSLFFFHLGRSFFFRVVMPDLFSGRSPFFNDYFVWRTSPSSFQLTDTMRCQNFALTRAQAEFEHFFTDDHYTALKMLHYTLNAVGKSPEPCILPPLPSSVGIR